MEDQNNEKNTEPVEDLEVCKKQRDEYLAGWQRAKADFINYKKEEMRRLEEIARYGNEELIREFISVMDSFDLGIAVLEKERRADKGVYMIRAQIEDILRKQGLTRISVTPGDRFDPHTTEAVAELESDKPEGTIIEEIEAGYRLHDKVIRPARVKVSKGRT